MTLSRRLVNAPLTRTTGLIIPKERLKEGDTFPQVCYLVHSGVQVIMSAPGAQERQVSTSLRQQNTHRIPLLREGSKGGSRLSVPQMHHRPSFLLQSLTKHRRYGNTQAGRDRQVAYCQEVTFYLLSTRLKVSHTLRVPLTLSF